MPSLRLLPLVAVVFAGCPVDPVDEGEGDGSEGEGDVVSEGEGDVAGEGEGEGEGGVIDVLRGLRVNEVGCEGVDFVEFVVVGADPVVVDGFAITDRPGDPSRDTALTGTLAPGAFLVVTPGFGLGCGEPLSIVTTGALRVVVDTVVSPDDVAGGSFGRLPDGTGEFVVTSKTPNATNQSYVDPSEVFFQPLADPLRFDLTISPEAEASLRDGATEYDYVEASLVVSGNGVAEEAVVVGARKKGKVGSRRGFDQKMAWKLDFDRFVPGQRHRRLAKINLNNMVQDPSTIHEQMAYRVLSDAGLPAPRTGNATLFVNGVEFGTYLVLEAFDDDLYLSRNLPPDLVALFEGGLTEAACCDFADVFDFEIGRFEHDAGDEAVGRAALAELSSRLNTAPSNEVFAQLDPIVDWDQVLTTMAEESVIGHWDGYQVSPNNFYVHLSGDNKWRLIASGVDQTFGHEGRVDVVFNGQGRLFQRCREDPVCAARYNDRLRDAVARGRALLAGGFSADVDALVAHHMATFSRARLEADLESMPARKADAFAYFAERLDVLSRALACDGQGDGASCEVDAVAGTCQGFFGGLGCF